MRLYHATGNVVHTNGYKNCLTSYLQVCDTTTCFYAWKNKLIIERYCMWTSYVYQSTWKKNWLGLKIMSLDYVVWNSYTTKELSIGYCTKFWLYTFVENWGMLLNNQVCNRARLCDILKIFVNSENLKFEQ